jgi:hypothetical protein
VGIEAAKDSPELAIHAQGKTVKLGKDEKGIARLLATLNAVEVSMGAPRAASSAKQGIR